MNSFFSRRFGVRASGLCFAAVLASGAVGCTDDGMSEETGDGDTTGDGDGDGDAGGLSHAADIQKIWDTNCVGCHNPDGVAPILDLSGDAYDNIVGSLSAQATTTQLIEVGNSGDSYLVAKLRGAQADFEGGTGTQMPSGMNPIVPLPESTIETIETWIDEGALP